MMARLLDNHALEPGVSEEAGVLEGRIYGPRCNCLDCGEGCNLPGCSCGKMIPPTGWIKEFLENDDHDR